MLVPLLVVLLAPVAPARVQVVALSEASLPRAEALRSELAGEPLLKVLPDVLLPRSSRVASPLGAEERLLSDARGEYESLRADAALERLARLQAALAPRLDEPAAAALLARALRLRALALLYLGRRAEADAAFVSASFLEPDYSPGVDEWPPEARLAHADAVAASRRRGSGVLSVRVDPDFATLYLDGRAAAVGPATLADLAPGQHALLATAPGHAPLAALVDVSGDGTLDDTSLFLERLGGGADPGGLVAALAAELGGRGERPIASALAGRRSVEALVVVGPETLGGPLAAWLFGETGERRGGPLPLEAAALAQRVAGGELALEAPPPLEPAAWYMSRWLWAGAGALLVAAAGTGLYFALADDEPSLVNLYVGRRH